MCMLHSHGGRHTLKFFQSCNVGSMQMSNVTGYIKYPEPFHAQAPPLPNMPRQACLLLGA